MLAFLGDGAYPFEVCMRGFIMGTIKTIDLNMRAGSRMKTNLIMDLMLLARCDQHDLPGVSDGRSSRLISALHWYTD